MTHSVCKEVGLAGEKIITGNELQQLNQEELRKPFKRIIFSPKLRLTKSSYCNALTENGQTVGF